MKIDWGIEADEAAPAAWLDDETAVEDPKSPPRVANVVVGLSIIGIVCTLLVQAAARLLFG